MRFAILLGVLVVLLLTVPVASQAPDDMLILPGVRIGKWTLEMTIDDLVRMNGPQNAVAGRPAVEPVTAADAPPGLWVHRWANLGLVVLTIGRESQAVAQLYVLRQEYRTEEGVGVGSSREAILTAYGPPTLATEPQPGIWSPVYDEIGLAFEISARNVAATASVFRRGTAKQRYK